MRERVCTQVVAQKLVRRQSNPLDRLTSRERGAGIETRFVVSESAVAKHITSTLAKLDLPPGGADDRRVLAMLHFLGVPIS